MISDDLEEKHHKLIHWVVLKFINSGLERDDLLQEAYLRYLEIKVNPDNRDKLKKSTFLVACLRNHMINLCKSQNQKIKMFVYLEDNIVPAEYFKDSFDCTEFSDPRIIMGFKRLSEIEQKVIKLTYVNELSDKEIEKKINIKYKNIKVIRWRALKKLRDYIKKYECNFL